MEEELRKSEDSLRTIDRRLRLAINSARMYVDDWEMGTGRITRSPEAADVLGKDVPLQTTRQELMTQIHPDDRARLELCFECLTPEHPTSHVSYRLIRPDGELILLEKSAFGRFDRKGKLVRTIGVVADITDRKQAEEALLLVANTAPVMIWLSGRDKMCTYVNQQWLDFTGRPLEAELGNGWTDNIHPENLHACLETYSQAFDKRESFEVQYRLRRHDGQYRWLYDRGVPRFDSDGSFAGYIGACYDVTDCKLAEETIANLGRRLIEAHEKERTWIARELHDDVNQRVALLTIELQRWSRDVPESAADIRLHLEQARKRLLEISKDVQALSHRLHSSKLEYLGLAAAARSFCRELAEQQKISIEFSHSDIPSDLAPEVSLSLFRVMQEALQNAVKHSHTRKCEVDLRNEQGEVHLTVSDCGIGFDQRKAIGGPGLGLISMRERLQLVSGTLVIESQPEKGTTIRARVPLQTGFTELSAVG